MSNIRVGKLRKTLAIIFAFLSLLFAGIAISNKLSTRHNTETQATTSTDNTWGRNIESRARNENKLIFFFSDKSVTQSLSEKSKKILSERYICVKISHENFPADFTILDAPLAKISKKSGSLKAGILSPNLHPIYLTSEILADKKNRTLSLEDAIIAATNQFDKNAYTLKKTARQATTFDAIPRDSFSPFFGNSFTRLSFLHAESSRMFIYFNSNAPMSAEPAILSENARLAARISLLGYTQIAAQNATALATKILCARIATESKNNFAKLLFLRALGESPYVLTDNRVKNFYLQNVKETTLCETQKINDIALSTSILLRTFAISKDKEFFNNAKIRAKRLAEIAFTQKTLPSKIGEISEASSLDYALCARAFWDIAKFSNDENWHSATKEIIARWNENFMTPFNLWSINSKKSALAKIARPIITRDCASPSYIGEAAQLFAEMEILQARKKFNSPETSREIHFGKTETRCAQNLKKLAFGASTISPLANPQWASLKLAMLPTNK